MPSMKSLRVGEGQTLSVYSLPSNKAVTSQRISVSERGRVWAIDSKGTLRASNFRDIRTSASYGPYKSVPLKYLSVADIKALGALGLIDAVQVEQRKRDSMRADYYESEFKDLARGVESLIEAGVKVPKNWEKRAAVHAGRKADERLQRLFQN